MQKEIQHSLNNNYEHSLTAIKSRHSDEIDEIISQIPSWILRWGIVLFAGILLMAISISAIIRYPETVKAPVRFEAGNLKQGPVFTGIVKITENDITKIKLGQQVLIRLRIDPAQQYGKLTGRIIDIADGPDGHQLFTLKVQLMDKGINPSFKVKKWMTGNAEIITQDVTVLQRIYLSLTKNTWRRP